MRIWRVSIRCISMSSNAESDAAAGVAGGAAAVNGLGARLLRNLVLQSSSQGTSLVLGLVTGAVLARELGVDGFGDFGYLFAVLYMALSVADFGVSTILLREVARDPSQTEALVARGMGLKLVMAALAMAGVAVFSILSTAGDLRWSLLIFSIILPLQALSVPAVVLQAHVMIKRGVAIELANRGTGFVLMMAAVFAGLGLIGVTVALVLGELAGLLVVLRLTRVHVRTRPRFDLVAWRHMLAASASLGVIGLLTVLVNRLDFLMLKEFADSSAVGLYNAAYRLPNLLERLPLLAMATVFPLMSRLADSDPRELRRVYRWSVWRGLMMAVPIVAIVSAVAPIVVRLWFGSEYDGAVLPLRLLIWSTGCMYVSVIAGNTLVSLGRVKRSLHAWLAGATLNVGLNWWWIPTYGAAGAAAATSLSFALAMVISLVFVQHDLEQACANRPTDPQIPRAS